MKNKKMPAVAATLAVCAFLASCGTTNTPVRTGDKDSEIPVKPNQEHFHFVEREDDAPSIVKPQGETDVVYIKNSCEEVSFVAHDRVDSEAAKAMNAVLDRAYENHEASTSAMTKDLDAYFADEAFDMSVFPWETKVDYSCTRNDGKAISVIETVDFYSGGTLSGTTIRTFNFEPLTGAQVVNVFYNPADNDDFNAADDMIYKALIAKYGEDSGITYAMPELSSMVEEALASWYFTENGVKIIFNPGTIAPIEKGTFELELEKNVLSEQAQKFFN